MGNSNQKICFIVCPIGSDSSEARKRSDTVLRHIIKPVCETAGYEVIRVDQLVTVDRIDSTIIKYLDTADLVIADMTDHNPNVFYEFGYRQAKRLPLIPIIQENDNIPFDVSTLRTIKYVIDNLDKVDDCKKRLAETIQSFTDSEMSQNHNDMQPTATFESSAFLSIHDKLDDIIELLHQKNTDIIDIVTSQVAKYAQPQQSPEVTLMTTLLPTLLQNPDAMNNLMRLSELGNKTRK
ncbi:MULTISPECIES: hypothetical protein [Glaesserella]|uniref:Nucleoside 2-deoxyribosyltransferase n=1 Tax=Glaesserella australis TaxID=2094024 RepID=A0A328BX11_9PAST|nr:MULTISPECIES: hypothetical protein [Glaesserella]AUI67073.1 hypothetical protein CJD39_11100 [Glaesserella sp. 15-184]RAL18185.1 hypothetical protein C5N92_09920 [Glaesserella australis]